MPSCVALFTRAWIEIFVHILRTYKHFVALFTRAWIEIRPYRAVYAYRWRRPLHEGVD